MATPLYRKLKQSGATFYAFPGSAEDLSAQYQNDNYKVRFNKFVLLNLNVEEFDYSVFDTSSNLISNDNAEKLVTSLRSYVANHEVVLRGSRINQNEFYYDSSELSTTTEKIFWKWLRSIGGIEFEPADPNDEYVVSSSLQVDENLPVDYFPSYIWKERENTEYEIEDIQPVQTINLNGTPTDVQTITFSSTTNFKPEDELIITNNGTIDIGVEPGQKIKLRIIPSTFGSIQSQSGSRNNVIRVDIRDVETGNVQPLNWVNGATVTAAIDYTRKVQYIGEIAAVNNTQIQNEAYTQIYAYLPAQAGMTPDVLFDVGTDANYKPGLQFPILPSQDQPEIVGGEQPNSPILSQPELYPGDQYAQFDEGQKYKTSSGFTDRKRGNYYGIPSETNRNNSRVRSSPYVWPEFDDTQLDGITLNFDPNDYTRMNLPGQRSRNFDEFNQQRLNNEFPNDFEFNAILWYYEVEDTSQLGPEVENDSSTETEVGQDNTTITRTSTRTETFNNVPRNTATNLYGIQFLNGLDTDVFNPSERGIEKYQKLVATDVQDGLSYSFSLNQNFKLETQQLQQVFDPDKIYNLFGFDLFNEVMNSFAKTNQDFEKTINDVIDVKKDMVALKSLVYNQTDLDVINQRISNLDRLLRLYSSLQIGDSDSITSTLDNTVSPPVVRLNARQKGLSNNFIIRSSNLYNSETQLSVPRIIEVPTNTDFAVTLINDDQQNLEIQGNLNVLLNRDLAEKQTCKIWILPEESNQNKQVTISMRTDAINPDLYSQAQGWPLISNINLPVDLNNDPNVNVEPLEQRWNTIPDQIQVSGLRVSQVSDSYFLNISIPGIYSSFSSGDSVNVPNLRLVLDNGNIIDFSGQYVLVRDVIESAASFGNRYELQVELDPTTGKQYFEDLRVTNPGLDIIEVPFSKIYEPPIVEINTGWEITITNINTQESDLNKRYLTQIKKLKRNLLNEI